MVNITHGELFRSKNDIFFILFYFILTGNFGSLFVILAFKHIRRDHHAQSGLLSSLWSTGGSNHWSQISALFPHRFKRRGDATSSQESVHHNEVWRRTVKYEESDSSFITARKQKMSEAQLNFAAGRRPDPRTSLRAAPIREEERETALHHTQQPKKEISVISETTRESKFGS